MSPAQKTRILFHPGFHKTGTTSLQDYMYRHAAALSDYCSVYIHLGQADARASGYGHKALPWRLWAYRRALRTFLAGIPDARVLFFSRESFCGVMPGRRDLRGRLIQRYVPTARTLCGIALAEFRARFGPDTQIEMLFTIRDQEPWLRSVYGQALLVHRTVQDYGAWRSRFTEAMDLEDQAREIMYHFPGVAMHIRRLEDYGNHHAGIASCALELLGIPEDIVMNLPPAQRMNTRRSQELEAQFLEINRSGLSFSAALAAKQKLLTAER